MEMNNKKILLAFISLVGIIWLTGLAFAFVCQSDAECDDGDANTMDRCAGIGRSTADCVHLTRCGDLQCDSEESKCSCPEDCGECTGIVPGICREYACIGIICRRTIKLNCCGNGKCESGEDFGNCSVDCAPKNISIALTGCEAGRNYLRGDAVEMRAVIEADGVKIRDAEVKATGFFGEVKIYNDGRHNDGTRNDNVYANQIIVEEEVGEGTYYVIVEAEFLGVKATAETQCIINPTLEMSLTTDKSLYFLGDNIEISGRVSRKDQGLMLPVELKVIADEKIIIEKDIYSDEQGNFSLSYHSTLLDEPGLWKIIAMTEDENRNMGLIKKEINFVEPGATVFLNLEVAELKEVYSRGESVDLNVEVTGSDQALIGDAIVEVRGFELAVHRLEEISQGKYSGSILLGYDAPLGRQQWEITASKIDMNVNYSGRKTIEFDVNAIELGIELLEPKIKLFKIGEEINFKVKITYPDGQPVIVSDINASVNNKKVQMTATEGGIYVCSYIVDEGDANVVSFSIELNDMYANKASFEGAPIEILGVSYLHYARKYGIPIVLFALAGIIVMAKLSLYSGKKIRLKKLRKREKGLLLTLKSIQTQYFKQGIMDAKDYSAKINKYETELVEVRESIDRLTKKSKK